MAKTYMTAEKLRKIAKKIPEGVKPRTKLSLTEPEIFPDFDEEIRRLSRINPLSDYELNMPPNKK
jgi:hypothetical protein